MSEVCPIGPASTARLPYGLLTTLRSIVARWSERRRSRRELARLATAGEARTAAASTTLSVTLSAA